MVFTLRKCIHDWQQVKNDLQMAVQKEGLEMLPSAVFLLWRLVNDVLWNDSA